jgi:hypothetical protein
MGQRPAQVQKLVIAAVNAATAASCVHVGGEKLNQARVDYVERPVVVVVSQQTPSWAQSAPCGVPTAVLVDAIRVLRCAPLALPCHA